MRVDYSTLLWWLHSTVNLLQLSKKYIKVITEYAGKQMEKFHCLAMNNQVCKLYRSVWQQLQHHHVQLKVICGLEYLPALSVSKSADVELPAEEPPSKVHKQ